MTADRSTGAHDSDRSTTVLKLGGSLITEKDRAETVDEGALGAAAEAVADHGGRLAVVHGGGSFGHPYAEAAGISSTVGSHDVPAVMAVHEAMKRLNAAVLAALHDRDVPALPVHPFSAAARDADGALTYPLDAVATMLDEGFTPVLHGDGVVHAGEGVSVLSGDELVARLGTGLDADRIGLCSTVPGVLDEEGEVIPVVSSFADVADAVGASESTDVTGGMAGKVRSLLAVEATAFVFGPAELSAFLAGEDVGTRIE